MFLLYIFFFFLYKSELYNYANDNTLSYAHTELDKLINTFEDESKI